MKPAEDCLPQRFLSTLKGSVLIRQFTCCARSQCRYKLCSGLVFDDKNPRQQFKAAAIIVQSGPNAVAPFRHRGINGTTKTSSDTPGR